MTTNFKKGDKVNTALGSGVIAEMYGKNVSVKMDKKDYKNREVFRNFSIEELVCA